MARIIKKNELRSSIYENYRRLGHHRDRRKEVLDAYGGPRYGSESDPAAQPINLIELGLTTYITQLVPLMPKAFINTWQQDLMPTANMLRLSCNQVAKKCDLADELEEAVINANCGLGIMKIGIQRDPSINVLHDMGQPYCTSVSLDDWIHDTTSRRWGECYYYGQRVRMDMEDILENDEYDNAASKEAYEYSSNEKTNQWTFENGTNPVSNLSHGDGYNGESLFRGLDVWELYFPRQRVYMILPCEGGDPLVVRRWTGHRDGPYRFLRMGRMPDNLMGVAPGVSWLDQHNWINNIWNKLQDQAERQKTLLTYRDQTGQEEAERVAAAKDSMCAYMADPNRTNIFTIPGIDQPTFGFALNVMERWSHDAGNIELMGGLGAQSDTLGQDQLLQANASSRMNYLKTKVFRFISQIFESIAYEIWTDPNLHMKVTYDDPFTGSQIPMEFTQADFNGALEDFEFSVEPYSGTFMSPDEKINFLFTINERIIQPALMGGTLQQMAPLVQKISELRNMPEVQHVFGNMMPLIPMQGSLNPLNAGKPANTTRTENRISHPQATPQGHSQNMQQLMMGKNSQPTQQVGAN